MLKAIKHHYLKLGTLLTIACLIFLAAVHPIISYDTFFGLAIGKYVLSHQQIPTTEPFSWSAYGRPIIAYEWLAQTLIYILNQLGGLVALEIYVALMLTLFFLINFCLLYYCFKRDFLSSLTIAIFLSFTVYEFFVARPQIIAFVCLVVLIFLIMAKILLNKNLLFLSLPLTYLWTNSHASFIFIPYLFFSYALMSFSYLRSDHPPKAIQTAKQLTIFGFLNLLVTILPPLGFGPYKLLLDFSSDLAFMTKFVSEWNSLEANPTYLYFYILVVVISLIISLYFAIRNKIKLKWVLALPLLLISLASFQAIRHYPLGITSSLIILALFLPNFSFKKSNLVISLAVMTILLTASAWFIKDKKGFIDEGSWTVPTSDIKFMQQHQLQGKMFNDFALGGFLIYHLYPNYQVFFDGRADIYHCCEMRAYWNLISAKHHSKEQFGRELKSFWDKYQFSYLVTDINPTNINPYNPLFFTTSTLMADYLLSDPQFSLVYFSDRLQIVVKDDGQNSNLTNKFGMKAVTPTHLISYKAGQEQQALAEYTKMLAIVDSGLGRVGLGQVFYNLGQLDQAKEQFSKATQVNPYLGIPYLWLGKVALKENQPQQAVVNFKKALEISPYLGEAYLLLGQTYLGQNRPDLARQVLNRGLRADIDFISMRDIIQAISKLNSDMILK